MIINSYWYTPISGECIGIVQFVQEHEKEQYRQTGVADFKYYIGLGNGVHEKLDAEMISKYGAPFDKVAGDVLFGVSND